MPTYNELNIDNYKILFTHQIIDYHKIINKS